MSKLLYPKFNKLLKVYNRTNSKNSTDNNNNPTAYVGIEIRKRIIILQVIILEQIFTNLSFECINTRADAQAAAIKNACILVDNSINDFTTSQRFTIDLHVLVIYNTL